MQAAAETLWPWLVVAGMGALHGLNPASGWAIAAAWGLQARSRAQAWWALLPIALGHASSMALVAVAVVEGMPFDRTALQLLVAALLVVVVALHLWRHHASRRRWPTGPAGLALGSFLMSGAHGVGLTLVPALVPLCLGAGPSREAGTAEPLALAFAAVGVHMAAMLLVTGLMAAGVSAGATRLPHLAAVLMKTWRTLCARPASAYGYTVRCRGPDPCPSTLMPFPFGKTIASRVTPLPSTLSKFGRDARRRHGGPPSTPSSSQAQTTP